VIELVWGGFLVLFLGLLFLDLSVLHRESAELSVRQALFWTAVWVFLIVRLCPYAPCI